MTPKEKALQLCGESIILSAKITLIGGVFIEDGKLIATFVVDEILNLDYFSEEGRAYWIEVKKEIELL